MYFLLFLAFMWFWFGHMYKKIATEKYDTKSTTGVIDGRVSTEHGGFWYYVYFRDLDTNEYVRGQSRVGGAGSTRLNSGDEVNIEYFYNKNGTARVIITDDTQVPLSNGWKKTFSIFNLLGVVSLIVFAVLFLGILN